MSLTRRALIRMLAGAVPALKTARALGVGDSVPPIRRGPFHATRESLKGYRVPEWFRDAKFGIWAHWGPQSAAEYGDWYARNMYIQGQWQYEHHVKTYGHPSRFGFKDIIPTWKAARFDADHLVGLYKQAGARYFVSLGVHHDNFDLWDSKHQRWNSVRMGPRRDIVGEFRRAALRHGLRFGVSEHLSMSYKWFSVSHGSDREGPLAGVPYDGADPRYADLYHDIKQVYVDLPWNLDNTSEAFKRVWYLRVRDLVDKYRPDILYTDGEIPFGDFGLMQTANLYNLSAERHGGRVEAVQLSKKREDCEVGTCVMDVERGVVETVWPAPWQSHTCVGNWHYLKGGTYKSPKAVIDMLVDVVSRNGNLLLNFPLPNDGMLDAEELKILSAITDWMRVNGEAIHDTRPWKIYGTGPAAAASGADAKFNESKRRELTAEDVRFTRKGQTLYAFFMGWPERGEVNVASLATPGGLAAGRVGKVELLGFPGELKWSQDAEGLKVRLPEERPGSHAFALRVEGLKLDQA
ncbi:MAG TPA: alpha-L-fucosidase [Pyrinomonadaceae bacterium]|nr:alpha-L-fucosidase [Pyrinomonadaceae bacterium]